MTIQQDEKLKINFIWPNTGIHIGKCHHDIVVHNILLSSLTCYVWIHHCWSQWWALCSWIWPNDLVKASLTQLAVTSIICIGLLTDSGFSWFMSVVLPLLSSPTQRTLASLFLSPSHVTKLSKKPMVFPTCANCWVGSGQYLPWHNVVSMVTSNACVMRFSRILGVPSNYHLLWAAGGRR